MTTQNYITDPKSQVPSLVNKLFMQI